MIKNHRQSLRTLIDESTKFSQHNHNDDDEDDYDYNHYKRRQLAILLSNERANLIRISIGYGLFYLPPNNPLTTINQNIISIAINNHLHDQYHRNFNQL